MTNNGSKRSMASSSKGRSSTKGGSKEFGRLITQSKLRLSGNLKHKPETSTSKYTSKAQDLKIRSLEETNIILANENDMLHQENDQLKLKLAAITKRLVESAEAMDSMELLLSSISGKLISERSTCQKIYDEYTILTREKEKDIMNAEMNQNYLETKNSLLKEVLTKR